MGILAFVPQAKCLGEWLGFVPFEDMPHSENPVQGYLTSSNQIIAGPEFLKNYSLQESLYLADGYRARRINSVLANGDDIIIADMQSLQLDFYSVRAGNFTSYLLDVLNSITTKTTLQEEVIDLLVDWDYCMDKDGAAPSIFNVWLEIFRKETFNDRNSR